MERTKTLGVAIAKKPVNMIQRWIVRRLVEEANELADRLIHVQQISRGRTDVDSSYFDGSRLDDRGIADRDRGLFDEAVNGKGHGVVAADPGIVANA